MKREQRNYTPQAKRLLEEIILSIALEQDGIKIVNSKIKSIQGEVIIVFYELLLEIHVYSKKAEINVRKGKQILCYEFNVEVEFKGIPLIIVLIKLNYKIFS